MRSRPVVTSHHHPVCWVALRSLAARVSANTAQPFGLIYTPRSRKLRDSLRFVARSSLFSKKKKIPKIAGSTPADFPTQAQSNGSVQSLLLGSSTAPALTSKVGTFTLPCGAERFHVCIHASKFLCKSLTGLRKTEDTALLPRRKTSLAAVEWANCIAGSHTLVL